MFATRFFCARMFAPRYFPKVGEDPSGDFQPAWARFCNVVISPVV